MKIGFFGLGFKTDFKCRNAKDTIKGALPPPPPKKKKKVLDCNQKCVFYRPFSQPLFIN